MAFLGEGGDHPSLGQWQGGHVESGASLGGSDSAGHLQVVLCGNCRAGTGLVRCYIRSKRKRYIDGVEENVLWMFMDKQAVGVQLGEVVVQGCVDGQELVQEHQDTWCN